MVVGTFEAENHMLSAAIGNPAWTLKPWDMHAVVLPLANCCMEKFDRLGPNDSGVDCATGS